MAASKLDFKFAPIDLEILTHPRMLEACAGGDVTPFAIWSWVVIYVTKYKTSGVISRSVINSALGGGDHSIAVEKLIAVGLFVETQDGRIKVWNHEKKSPKVLEDARSKAAKRQADYIARKKAKAANDHASPESRTGVRDDVSTDVIPSNISPLISPSGSDLKSRSEEPTQSPRVDDTVVHTGDPVPDDARSKFESLTMTRPLRTPLADVWAKFCNHFAGNHFPSRERMIGRWDTWVRDQFTYDDKARRGRPDTRQPLTGPEPEWLTRAKSTGTDGTEPF